MPTGLQAEAGYHHPDADPKVEAAKVELDRLKQRQRELPNLMREAAVRGDFRAVGDLRVELEQLPLMRWAADYTATHAAIAARGRGWGADMIGLKQRARELAAELVNRPAWPSHRPL
jgi:hypothetical protein